jgi:hypothetical protein
MVAYDCDDEKQFAELLAHIGEFGSFADNQLQGFAPDSPSEARNRGFRICTNLDLDSDHLATSTKPIDSLHRS